MFSLDIAVVEKRNQKMIEIFTSELKTPSDTTFKKYETSVKHMIDLTKKSI